MYVGTHGTDDPTLATLPFLLATGAASEEIDACVALIGEAVFLARPGMIEAVNGVGFPPLSEIVPKVREHGIPVYV